MDQQKRFIIAFALSMLVVVIFLLANPQKKKVPLKTDTTIHQNIEIETDSTTDTESVVITQPKIDTTTESIIPVEEFKEENELYQVTFSNAGATIKSFKLLQYTTCDDNLPEMIDLVPGDFKTQNVKYPFTISMEDDKYLDKAVYQTTRKLTSDENIVLEFKTVTPNNLEVIKKFTLSQDSYSLKLDIQFKNNDTSPLTIKDFKVNWGPGIIKTDISRLDKRYYGPIVKVDDKKITKPIKKKETEKRFEGKVSWILSGSKYFTVALKDGDESPITADGAYYFIQNEFLLNVGLFYDSISLEPGESKTIQVESYLGPKQKAHVTQFDEKLVDIASFKGWFGFLSNLFLELMKFLYKLIPNYGVVIIIITLLFKIVFYPLTHTSMKSMKKMQDIQPILQDLQKKYKDNPQQLQQETMRIYKTYGVNPFSGCLPLLLQMPIFIALYTTFGGAIELRCAPFIFWIQDLSRPDTIFTIPGIGLDINVLPILMGVAMLIQQMVQGNPQAQNQQTAMLKFLPLLFLFFFWNFPAGLVLYWLMNNIFTIFQTLIINKLGSSGKKV